jgi:hypothetical protein
MMVRLWLNQQKEDLCRQWCLEWTSLQDTTQVLNDSRIQGIDHHPAESEYDMAPERRSYLKHWLHQNGDLNYPDNREGIWAADNESERELEHGVLVSETQEQQDVSATPNVPGSILPSRWSKLCAENEAITVSTMESRRNMGMINKQDTMSQFIFTSFCM